MNDQQPYLDKPYSSAPPPVRRSSPWPWVILAIVLTPLLALIVAAVVTLGGIAAAWHTAQNLFAGRLVVRTEQPSVVTQIQQLNRLETVSYTVEKVIEGNRDQGSPLLNTLLGDRLLFVAHGTVVAGVDFSQLQPEDVVVNKDGAITIRLPAAEVLSHSLDNQQSRVYDRQIGLLAKGDPNLETMVRQQADQQILDAACQEGILQQADANAETQVRALLSTLGHPQVQFLAPRTDTASAEGC